MASNAHKTTINVPIASATKRNASSSTSPVGPRGGVTTRSGSEADTRNVNKVFKQQPAMAQTALGLVKQQSPKASCVSPVPPTDSVDGGGPPTTSAPTAVDPSPTTNKDMEQDIQERKQLELKLQLKLQQQFELLEARQKELEENEKMIISLTAERDGFKQELEQAVNKTKELSNMVKNDKLVMDALETDKQYMVQLKQKNERELNHMAERLNQDRDTIAKAQLANYNNTKTIDELRVERNDLRSRLSKVASDMLTAGGNPDIADLSDPNRAMKLSERFCGIYDDEWTDAFEILTQKHNKEAKEAVQLLLTFLKECLEWCTQTAQGQMDSLKNVVMHPDQSAKQDVKGGKDKVRIGSNELKALTDIRRKISTNSFYEIKVQCFTHLKRQRKRPADVDLMVVANTYCEKCVDVCWLMVLHDPPIHVGLDVKTGSKMDSALYSSYGGSGETIDFLVWPPLYNGTGGGLLAKGTASPVPSKKKARK